MTPPTVSIFLSPKVIWSPNLKMVDVLVNGVSSDDRGNVSTIFSVKDEYGRVEPNIDHFGQTIQLEAHRYGNDLDGRVYTISAIAKDRAGNVQNATDNVIVLHDNRDN